MSNASYAPEARAGTMGYVDRKRWLWPLSLVWAVAPVLTIYSAAASGNELFAWSTLIVWYLLIPLGDLVLGRDRSNPPAEAVPALEADRYYRHLTYLTVPAHYITFIFAAWALGTGEWSWFGYLGVALSVGIINGLAINTGHELGHKKTALERWLARIVLAVVAYGHFFVEHNKGHHKDVATPEDPASARLGENIYRFALREIPGAIRRAWESERKRLARQGRSVWSMRNEVLQPLAISVALYGGLLILFGPVLIPFMIIAIGFGWWQLTSANYVEHYGLLRRKMEDGRYERCRPHHSWNSNHIVSNLSLYHLQRHSDHHAWPTRRYQALRDFPDLPTLPAGYPTMFMLAYVPPLWHAVMDGRVVELQNGDFTQINVDPRKRAQLMARYGA